MPSSCRAQLQGDHRLEKGLIYFNHIVETYGGEIKEKHRLELVPNEGHNNFDMYHSPKGLHALFDDDPIISCADQTTATSHQKSSEVNIYTNPTQNTIRFDGLSGDESLRITDMSGRLLLTSEDAQSPTDISSLKSGLYIVQLVDKKNVVIKTFIKI